MSVDSGSDAARVSKQPMAMAGAESADVEEEKKPLAAAPVHHQLLAQSRTQSAASPALLHPPAIPTASLPQYHVNSPNLQQQPAGALAAGGSKYQQLLLMVDELGKDIRPTYNGNRNCQERLKRGIIQARILVRECMAELEKNRQHGSQ